MSDEPKTCCCRELQRRLEMVTEEAAWLRALNRVLLAKLKQQSRFRPRVADTVTTEVQHG